jgi:hypothetical protein
MKLQLVEADNQGTNTSNKKTGETGAPGELAGQSCQDRNQNYEKLPESVTWARKSKLGRRIGAEPGPQTEAKLTAARTAARQKSKQRK